MNNVYFCRMVKEEISYPVYRKYELNTSFFKITSPNTFIEIQVLGKKYFKYEKIASILPDFHLINDMLSLHNNHWVTATEFEFDEVYTNYLAGTGM